MSNSESQEPTAPEQARGDGMSVAGQRSESVLWAIESSGGTAPRLVLREATGGVSSPSPAQPDPHKDRYEVLGEIDKGGMGAVFRGRDLDLGREVALKVILKEHASDPALVRRFIEEAQIGGQLQHPGIVPVYELGLQADRRPYFSMKLVKGRTLQALLGERRDPADDRTRFLSIFEQVCQAVAYAHARGVINRDLKPSNVMVGAFGEVQVLDWGLAKVIAHGGTTAGKPPEARIATTEIRTLRDEVRGPRSQSGTALGTWAYMPPEQAVGDIERVDTRSDVFALGGILCEILTGRPPYPTHGQDAFTHAVQARLDDAYARLDACGADEELVRLAKRCLSREPEERPEDAGIVAREIGSYAASVELRARAAEVEAAEARVKAKEALKERRLVIALAATVLLALALGGGGFVWLESERRARATRVAREVSIALAEANLFRGEARASAGNDLSSWARALSAAQRAVAIAQSPDAAPETRGRAETHLKLVEAEEGSARSAADAAEKEQRLLDRVTELRARIVEDWDWAAADSEYADAFRDYGIDVDALPPDDPAARIRTTRIAARLAVALDDWSRARKAAGASGEAAWTRLREIAKAADPDPWRTRLREAPDLETLRVLEGATELASLPSETLDSLAGAVGEAGDLERAVELYRLARRLHPADVLVNLRLAQWLARLPDPPLDEEARCYSAVVALRPRCYTAWSDLGAVLSEKGDQDGAIAATREALRIRPDHAVAHSNLGNALRRKGAFEEALDECREALRLDPRLGAAHINLCRTLHDMGNLDGAIAAYREALRLAPEDADLHNGLGTALHDKGDVAGAVAAYCEAIRMRPRFAMAHANLGRCLNDRANASRDLSRALAACREAIRIDPTFAGAHDNLGLILRQAGELEAAIAEHREAVHLAPASAGYHLNLGNALDDKGDLDCAIAEYREAVRLEPGLATAHANLGIALRRKGDVRGAIAAQREAVRLDPRSAISHNNLGVALKATGDLDGAAAAFREAIRVDPTYERAYGNLADLLLRRRDYLGAVALFRDLVRIRPGSATAQTNLGLALKAAGRHEEALSVLRKCRELVTEPGDREGLDAQIHECETLRGIEAKLPDLLSGNARPSDAEEGVLVARLCYEKEMYKASAEYFRSALAEDAALADDVERGHRYDAACAAALAGSGAGRDAASLDEEARTALRRQAREWLRADLAAWERRLGADRVRARQTLAHWRLDPDLAGIRDPDRVPEPEREECRALWTAVDGLLAR